MVFLGVASAVLILLVAYLLTMGAYFSARRKNAVGENPCALAFSREPWIIRRVLALNRNKKDVRKVRLLCWWTIRDSNPGPID